MADRGEERRSGAFGASTTQVTSSQYNISQRLDAAKSAGGAQHEELPHTLGAQEARQASGFKGSKASRPKKTCFLPQTQSVSTPNPKESVPVSIKEQIKTNFGFTDSEDEEGG